MLQSLRNKFRDYKSECRAEFFSYIDQLLENEQVRLLDAYPQHFQFTRLRHSIDVAYNSFVIAKLLRFDCRSTARAGLLHDLFFHSEGQHSGSLLWSHPRIALENARQVCSLNKIEENIILRHMWLLTPWPPRYKEGFVVTFVDKYCAGREFLVCFMHRKRSYAFFAD